MNLNDLSTRLQLSPRGTALLERHVKLFQFRQAGPVIHKGQAVSGAYIVLEGKLRIYTYSAEGREANLYLLNPGETCVLTLNCLFNNLLYPAWVEAYRNSEVVFIPGSVYRELFSFESTIQDITVKSLSTLVFQLMDALEEMKTCNMEQRLARFILNNASTVGVLKATQQELANHIGTTREGIARIVQGFKSQGLVKTARGKIFIKNEARLASIVTPQDAQWPTDQLTNG